MTSKDKIMEDRLPHLEKKFHILEAKDVTKPSILITQFVSRCVECIGRGKGGISKNQ
jgi:hypothetical protein